MSEVSEQVNNEKPSEKIKCSKNSEAEPQINLKLDVVTRWNSMYMLNRAKRLRKTINLMTSKYIY